MGSHNFDSVGSSSITTLLLNGNFVVVSPNWNDGVSTSVGAVTWGNGSTGTFGVVSSANSIVGSHPNDSVGSSSVTVLKNGNFVVASSGWNDGVNTSVGAVTWGDGANGTFGVVGPSNSFVGSQNFDNVGNSGVVALSNGNYVIRSPNWADGAITGAGAVTWGNGSTGSFGPGGYGLISSSNSFVGSQNFDNVGNSGVVALLLNGNYVVGSSNWANGGSIQAGATTWGNGTNGTFGPGGYGAVSASNSFIGSHPFDSVGANIVALANGNYVMTTLNWANGGTTGAGVATWGNGTNGTFSPGGYGVVSASNSFVGTHLNDNVGLFSVSLIGNSNYVVNSPNWNSAFQAFTFGNGANGEFLIGGFGSVNTQNSVTGQAASTFAFGFAQPDSVNGTFIVGLSSESTSGRVRVGITDINQLTFLRAEAQSMTIPTAAVTAALNAGTNVTLQANNDITISSDITLTGVSPGSLTLTAGKSLTVNASITTNNGNLTLIANELLSNGVVDSLRSTGAANLLIGANTTINAGTGSLLFDLRNGAGKTFSTSGNLTVDSNASLLTLGSGNITLMAATNNINLKDGIAIHSHNGNILMIAGKNIVGNSGPNSVLTTGSGSLTFVVDNLFPISPNMGNGLFNIPNVNLLTNGGDLQLYAGAFGISTFPAVINGIPYIPGSHVHESYGIYYPNGTGGVPFEVFYKKTLPQFITPPPSQHQIASAQFFVATALAEPFYNWTLTNIGGNLGFDEYPPSFTAKDIISKPFIQILKKSKQPPESAQDRP